VTLGDAAATDTGVRVYLLGRLSVEVDGAMLPATCWRRRRPLDLLKLLASRRGHSAPRDEVTDHLWPEMDAERGAKNLYRAIHDLRQIIGASSVRLERGVLRLSDEVWTDVDAFESLVAATEIASLQRAADLYLGPLCPEDRDADWLADRRTALHDSYLVGATRVARHHVATSGFDAAIDVLHKLLALEPANEEAHRLLMRALSSSGSTNEALTQYDRCVDALAAMLDAQPGAQTTRLRDQLRDLARAPAREPTGPQLWARVTRRLTGTASPPPMYGREVALRSLDGLADVLAGRSQEQGSVLLISGPAGTGKSRLCAAVVDLARQHAATVLAGSAAEFGTPLPFAPYAEAWVEHVRATGGSVSDDPVASFRPAGGQPQQDTLRLFQAIERALVREADDASAVVLIVEDLQWADESSLHLLHYLARAARNAPVIVVGTYRSEEAPPGGALHALLSNLQREKLVTRIAIGPLSAADTAQHVRHLSDGHETYRFADRIYTLGGGNPLFTEELQRAHAELGPDSSERFVDETLSDVVLGRVSRLGPKTASFLQAASVAGRDFAFAWAQHVIDASDEQAVQACTRPPPAIDSDTRSCAR
jgi:DNA-binding SARP family transcriptional activator